MSLTIKVLQQGSGYKTPTKAARLGGMITSVDTGYTGDQATVALDTTTEYFWAATGTTGTSLAWHYDTAIACATGKKVYFAATVETTATGIDSIEIRVGGTTAGEITVMTQANPTANTRYRLAGIATLTASETGNIKLRVRMADTAGTTGKVLRVYNWQAIDLTTEFGAGSEPASADLETFYAWRLEGHVYSNYGMYHSYGDTFFKALKVASHGLEYNDTIMHRITLAAPEIHYMFSNVYVLNTNWIIVNTYSDTDDGAVLVDFNYWTKVDYTSYMLAKSFQCNMRSDVEGRCSMSFKGNSTWKPRLGMTVFVYDGTECLYSGRLTRMTISELNATNWRCDCEISPMIETLSWMPFEATDAEALTYGTTRNALEHVVFDYGNKINLDSDTGSGCLCFWRGRQDVGLAKAKLKDSYFKNMLEVVSSLCKSAGLTFYATPDRHFVARETSATPEDAPRDITDAVNPDYWDATYSSDMADYGNIFVLFGGSNDDGEQVVAVDSGVEAIEVRYTGGAARKAVWMSDSGIVDDTEALAVAAKYTHRYGTIIPGNFSFTTSDLDYRYGQKINVQVSSLGITATQTMLITDVLLYDADGINLLCQVSCTNRDSTDFDSGASGGSNAAMADLSSSASKIVTALTQSAGTFTPALVGSTDPGTFTYTTQTGQYVRHGNMVYITIKLVINAVSVAASGTLRITGLPFTAANRTQQLPVFTNNVDFSTGRTQVQLSIAASDTYGSLYASGDNVGWSAIDAATCTSADDIRVSGWYQVVV